MSHAVALDLVQILADARGDAAVLRKHGQEQMASTIETLCDQIDTATEDYRRFIPEADAITRSGHHAAWWRARFPALEREGHAKKERGVRLYRLMIVPTRARLAEARARGRAAARGEAA